MQQPSKEEQEVEDSAMNENEEDQSTADDQDVDLQDIIQQPQTEQQEVQQPTVDDNDEDGDFPVPDEDEEEPANAETSKFYSIFISK